MTASATKTPGSTSTTAPAPSALARFKVRRLDTDLFAVKVEKPDAIALADGRTIPGMAGDYRIVRGTHTLDVVSPERFAKEYEAKPVGGLQLTQKDCDALIERLGLGATKDGDALLAAIDRLAAVEIGQVRIPFTPGQLSELRHRAVKRGRTVELEIRAVISRIEEEIFHRGG
jgi:hypothetical protein